MGGFPRQCDKERNFQTFAAVWVTAAKLPVHFHQVQQPQNTEKFITVTFSSPQGAGDIGIEPSDRSKVTFMEIKK